VWNGGAVVTCQITLSRVPNRLVLLMGNTERTAKNSARA
jgi:hypothetical protein